MATELADARARFQRPIEAIVSRVQALHIPAYEFAEGECVTRELRPAVLELIADACCALDELTEACERAEPLGTGRSAVGPDAETPKQNRAMEQLKEIAFVARLELRQRAVQLTGLSRKSDREILLGECDCALQRIRKALSAADSAIAEAAGIEPLLLPSSALETSLAVRRAYAQLRAEILDPGPPTEGELTEQLRGAAEAIDVLTGWDVYPSLRLRDRLLVRGLQQRIASWLDAPEHATGTRLWQDLAACLEMFALISQRPELLEHDRAVVAPALAALCATPNVSDQLLVELRALAGLDRELDDLLAQQQPPPSANWLGVLERLARRLSLRVDAPGVDAA